MLITPYRVLVLSMVVDVQPELAGAAGLDVRRLDGVAPDALAHADSGVLALLQNRGFSYEIMQP